jgi:hypothetical protein
MNLTDLLYDNIFGNVWYQRLLAVLLLIIYFDTDTIRRQFSLPSKEEDEEVDEEVDEEAEKEVVDEEEEKLEKDTEEQYTSDFNSESESEDQSDSEKTLIKKHFKILNNIQSTKFKCKNYSCSYHYYCINDDIKLECCFCKICGNYICSSNTPAPKIMCTHYKLIDSVDSQIDIFSGHIRTDDEEDVRNTINSFFETSDELEMEFYRTRLRQFVYDELQTDKNEESDSSTTQT